MWDEYNNKLNNMDLEHLFLMQTLKTATVKTDHLTKGQKRSYCYYKL